jgi:hypothetical protein
VSKVELPTVADLRDRASKVELPKVELHKVELPKVELPTVAGLRADATDLATDAQEQATALYRKVLSTIK